MRIPSSSSHRSSANTENRSPASARFTGFQPWRVLQVILLWAIISATIFTLWTPTNFFSNDLVNQMLVAFETTPRSTAGPVFPTPTASPRPRIGIVSGHLDNDSGAVCPDGLKEADINLRIATLAKEILNKNGVDVDLLKEFDPRLKQYHAVALVSIHNDSCDYINAEATGFKVAAALSTTTAYRSEANRLTNCMTQRYQKVTGMRYHANSITNDMENYHAFNELHTMTTAAIIETGFMNLDREILTQKTDVVAQGVADGILCFVRNEPIGEATPIP